jgi:chlorophyll synthase
MTLNDFKAVKGDREMGVRSLPVQLGEQTAAGVACWIMGLPQLVVIMLLFAWGRPGHGLAVALLLGIQLLMMDYFLARVVRRAYWYSGFGVPFFVVGMMVSAFGLRSLIMEP